MTDKLRTKEHADRMAKALRENLKRRKAAARKEKNTTSAEAKKPDNQS